MKVQFLVYDDNDKEVWTDFFIDKNNIQGFYVPLDYDAELGKSVNVLYCGEVMTFKQDVHLLDYLKKRFVI